MACKGQREVTGSNTLNHPHIIWFLSLQRSRFDTLKHSCLFERNFEIESKTFGKYRFARRLKWRTAVQS